MVLVSQIEVLSEPTRAKEAPASMSREPSAAISPLHGLYRLGGELIALVYIAIIAEIACATGAVYVLFPELGALSHDVMTRPRGKSATTSAMNEWRQKAASNAGATSAILLRQMSVSSRKT